MEQNERLIQTPDWFQAPEQQFPNLRSVVRQEFASIAEAEEYADLLGVIARFGNYPMIADMVNETLTQLKERNLELPLSVLVDTRFFAHYGERADLAVAMTANQVVFINSAAFFWRDPIGVSQSLYESGLWSTPHPLHALYHEAGHLAQTSSLAQQKPLTPREAGIADAVSDRAKQDADEFVAEVYTGLLVGVNYDPDILRMYRRFGGHTL